MAYRKWKKPFDFRDTNPWKRATRVTFDLTMHITMYLLLFGLKHPDLASRGMEAY